MQPINHTDQYRRQIILPGIGEHGQHKLQQAKVLVVGAGGLGCPALQYLVAAGVGTIGIVDGDRVDITNLHRQILYGADDAGKSKANVASQKLRKQNPSCNIVVYDFFLEKTNAFALLESYDLVIDGSDNFATRYLLNDVCILLHKPLVYGAIYRFEGQVAVFNYKMPDGNYSAQYRDLFPEPPGNILNCEEAGVLGVLPGIIGTMQAAEVIKLITGIGQPLANRILNYNALSNDCIVLQLEATQAGAIAVPKTEAELLARDYNINEFITNNNMEIDSGAFNALLQQGFVAIDVREIHEKPNTHAFPYLKMPLSSFNAGKIDADNILLFCQSGVRSKIALERILDQHPNKKVFSLKGGIVSWLNNFKEEA
jgi:adenylyltransferase/sulfurtransferase